MSSVLSIVMADDHPLILLGLAAAIGQFPQQRVVAQAHDGRELLQVLLHTDCNVIVTDYNMGGEPAFDGMQLLARLRKKHPKRAIVVCTMVHNPALLRAMRQIGVSGIVSKDDGLVHVGHAVMAGARGVRYDSPRILADTGLGSNERTVTERLSQREREVLRMYAGGMGVSDIALKLGSSIKTVSTQKTVALRKLGLVRETDLFQYVRDSGLTALR
ncbi:response regulator transcription factor [Ralstonia pickettii]|uniref:response regulator transcription factor n=1 Tax=Ralstonia pickettii TaxID=329 RepID=UPI0027151816|nr:response regulator transcription factor [Ralstonia pickettii]WKZ85227.1 response regulator transcription factor [Ralstonia pickettii]